MNNYIIIYDGTFINLLTTIKYLLQANIKPQKIVIEGTYSPSLFETIIKPNIDNDPTFITKITKFRQSFLVERKIIWYHKYVKVEMLNDRFKKN